MLGDTREVWNRQDASLHLRRACKLNKKSNQRRTVQRHRWKAEGGSSEQAYSAIGAATSDWQETRFWKLEWVEFKVALVCLSGPGNSRYFISYTKPDVSILKYLAELFLCRRSICCRPKDGRRLLEHVCRAEHRRGNKIRSISMDVRWMPSN